MQLYFFPIINHKLFPFPINAGFLINYNFVIKIFVEEIKGRYNVDVKGKIYNRGVYNKTI